MTHHFEHPGELCPHDQRLLDALVECGFDPEALEALSPADRERVGALIGLFQLIEDYPVEDADETLVHATLARIDRREDERAARMAFDAAPEAGRRRRFRVPDFLSMAAVILIGASVVIPVSSYLSEQSIDRRCNGNLRRMGLAFSQYAGDHNGAMPMIQTGIFAGWSTKNHNVVNLKPMIEKGYCELKHMDCPGRHEGQYGESYSYQWQLPGQRPQWRIGRVTLVLGDRNPIIDAAFAGQFIPALSMSLNHGGRGQNVLASDGVTHWLEEPLIARNDNIWLPQGVDFLRKGDQPTDSSDTFLAH